jgi:hypothetical protein
MLGQCDGAGSHGTAEPVPKIQNIKKLSWSKPGPSFYKALQQLATGSCICEPVVNIFVAHLCVVVRHLVGR